MDKYDDLQAILNALNDYTNKYNVDQKKHKEVYNAILSLTATNTQTPKQNKTKKTTKTEPKKDVYDLWTGLIKNGMQQI